MNRMKGLQSLALARVAVGGLALMFLSGCAASEIMISKRNLDVQTKMSETVFLDPVGPEKMIMHIQIRNTSDKDNFDIAGPLKEAMIKKGYRITEDPNKAYYRLQANVLSVAKTDPTAAAAALHNGYGGAIALGAVAGGGVGYAAGGYGGAVGGGLIGGALGGVTEHVTGAFVKDVLFMVVTDIQLVEKAAEGVIVRQDSQQSLKQGIGGSSSQSSSEVTKFKKYRTRVVSTANKANLEYEEAAPALTQGLTKSLSGLF